MAKWGCRTCWWQEGGRCYLAPVDRLPDGRSTKMAEARCVGFKGKREVLNRATGGLFEDNPEALVIVSEKVEEREG